MKIYSTPQYTAPKPSLQVSLRAALGPGFQLGGPAGGLLNAAALDYHRTTNRF